MVIRGNPAPRETFRALMRSFSGIYVAPFPFLIHMKTELLYFSKEMGFQASRVDFLPHIAEWINVLFSSDLVVGAKIIDALTEDPSALVAMFLFFMATRGDIRSALRDADEMRQFMTDIKFPDALIQGALEQKFFEKIIWVRMDMTYYQVAQVLDANQDAYVNFVASTDRPCNAGLFTDKPFKNRDTE